MGVIDPLDTKVDDASRGAASGSRSATPPRRSWPTSSSATRSRDRSARRGQRYVRVPGQKRTYGVNVKADLSTRFADWIETNLLKLDAGKVRKVVFDNYKVEPRARACSVAGRSRSTIERKDSSGPWTDRPGPARRARSSNTEKLADADRRPGRPQDRRRPAQARRA